MADTTDQRLYREEAQTLGQIGAVLAASELPTVSVRLPGRLASAAVAAWERDDEGEREPESHEQRTIRRRAGALGLIGLAVKERGHADGEEVVVDLGPEVIGIAIDAADDLPS